MITLSRSIFLTCRNRVSAIPLSAIRIRRYTNETPSQQPQQQTPKQDFTVKSVNEIKNEAEKQKEELQKRKEMEILLKKAIMRGLRASILFVGAFIAFVYVLKKRGENSRFIKYLQSRFDIKRPEKTEETTEKTAEKASDDAIMDRKTRIEKLRQLKKELESKKEQKEQS